MVGTTWRQQREALGHIASQIQMLGLLSPLFLLSLGPRRMVPPHSGRPFLSRLSSENTLTQVSLSETLLHKQGGWVLRNNTGGG